MSIPASAIISVMGLIIIALLIAIFTLAARKQDDTSWEAIFPIDRVEKWIRVVWHVFSTMCVGAVIALVFMQFFTRSNFAGGVEFMQKAYTTPGMVERVVITGRSTREKE